MRTRDLAEKIANVYYVSIEKLEVEEGFNPRFDNNVEVEDLAASILFNDNTIREPLKVFKKGDSFVINNGHRRYFAVKHNMGKGHEAPLFPVIVEDEKPFEERLADTILSNDGRPFLPVEEGFIYKKLQENGWSIDKIRTRVGKSYDHVQGRLSLVSVDRLVDAVKTGKMSSTSATQAARVMSRSERKVSDAILEKAIQGDKKANARLMKSDSKGRFFLKKSQKSLMKGWAETAQLDKILAACQILEMDLDAFDSVDFEIVDEFKDAVRDYLSKNLEI